MDNLKLEFFHVVIWMACFILVVVLLNSHFKTLDYYLMHCLLNLGDDDELAFISGEGVECEEGNSAADSHISFEKVFPPQGSESKQCISSFRSKVLSISLHRVQNQNNVFLSFRSKVLSICASELLVCKAL